MTMDAEALYLNLLEQISTSIAKQARSPHLIGVHSGGAWIAERLHRDLKLASPLGYLSSAFHRDDYNARGSAQNIKSANFKPTQLNFDVNGADLIVVDDILYTGRTVRAVMNELFDFGRAASIEMAVLIDRGGRQLPVAARFCGGVHPLPPHESFILSMTTEGEFSLRTQAN